MLESEKQAVLKVINNLWAYDPWKWGNTCASLINHEIAFDKPAIVEVDGEYITANVYVKDGREFQVGYQEGGWWMCFIKDSDDPRARLTISNQENGHVQENVQCTRLCGQHQNC